MKPHDLALATRRRCGVLLGGLSSEREVSLRTGDAVLGALRERGHDVVPIYVDRDVDVALRQERIEVAFIALHGRGGEDGCIQGMLETLGIPYTGSDVLASALAMHKLRAKELFRLHNLPTPAYYALTAADATDVPRAHADFGFPCVVKPLREGSSVGVTVCHSLRALADAVEQALRFDDELLVERQITGREISVAVLGDRAVGAIEIAPRGGFFDYANKYTRGTTEYFVPPRLSPERYRRILGQAQRAHAALGCRGATRVDMIVSDSGNEFLLEINTVPALTPTSLLARVAEASGISFGELCEMILAEATLASCRGSHRDERRLARWPLAGNDRREPVVEHH